MNKNNLSKRPFKDERDEQITMRSKSHALEFMTAFTQILTIICLIKENPAWKGSLALLFIGMATIFFYKQKQYNEKLYGKIGVIMGAIGVALILWFVMTV